MAKRKTEYQKSKEAAEKATKAKVDVTKSEFLDWKQSRVSKEVFRILESRIQSLQEALGNGVAYGNEVAYADHVGRIQAYRDMLEIEFED